MSLFSPIHHTFAPHVDGAYLGRTLGLILRPWLWQRGEASGELARAIGNRFGGDAHLFASGREALFAFLKTLNLKPGDEVILQSYTCVVVPNAITAAGGAPVYAEIDPDTLSMTPESAKAVITDRTRAIVCQHTFGIPAPTKELRALCDERKIVLIEDCAHIIPDENGPQEIGVHGDALIFSFGRDKAISGVAGGALVVRNSTYNLQPTTYNLQPLTIARLLLYPLLYTLARPLYGLVVGKAFLLLARSMGLLVPIETSDEKQGRMDTKVRSMPNACAILTLAQWGRLRAINNHRRRLGAFYASEFSKCGLAVLQGIHPDLPLQKFPLFLKNADGMRRALKKHNIHLNDGWMGCVICPPGIDLNAAHYTPGSDPQTEAACQKIISLPTHPTMTMEQARKLTEALGKLQMRM